MWIAALAAVPLIAAAQSSPFAGKTITLVVGYKPGGGYDATARLPRARIIEPPSPGGFGASA